MVWSSRQISGPITIAVYQAYSSLKYANPQADTCDSAENMRYLDDTLAETHPCFPFPFWESDFQTFTNL